MKKLVYVVPVSEKDRNQDNMWLDFLTKETAVTHAANGDSIYKATLVKVGKVEDGKFVPIKRRKK